MNTITYECDGSQAVWPVPFVVSGALAVSRIVGGIERKLAEGRDYLVSDGQVFCVSAPGTKIRIMDLVGSGVEANISGTGGSGRAAASLAYGASPAATVPEAEILAREEARDALIANVSGEVESITARARADIQGEAGAAAGQISAKLASADASVQDMLEKTADYCQSMASESRKAADLARRAAITATAKWRHGIAAVKDIAEIPFASGGLFVVIPPISHAPTPFMGIWPTDCPCKINYDGVFFIGPPYPAKPNIPDLECPPDFNGPKANGDADDWIPCGHLHFQDCPQSCPCRQQAKE